ncbi:sulfotransferase [Actinopolymorpha sp. NPDC004070]|uniref:sulfotransferase n=1 Tax=Actinopolymorpha sp. NPDC004070 TaxID=3154548 RepID=UPI0033A79EDB
MGEVVHLWQRMVIDGEACGCGEPFLSCKFWQAVGCEAFGGWSPGRAAEALQLKESVDRLRFLPRLLSRELPAELASRVERYTGLYDRLYSATARVSGSDVVVDGSKHASLAGCLRHRYGEDLRVVHVVRDPRAVAYSWGKQSPRPMATVASKEHEMARYSPGRAAVQWNAENVALIALARRGVPTLRVKYEDFATQPWETLAQISKFADLPGDLPMGPDRSAALSPTHAVSGHPQLWTMDHLTIREDTSWQTDLRYRDRTLVSLITAPTRRRLGY